MPQFMFQEYQQKQMYRHVGILHTFVCLLTLVLYPFSMFLCVFFSVCFIIFSSLFMGSCLIQIKID